MICEYADDPEMIAYAKEMGAKGINVAGVCCTSNEVAMPAACRWQVTSCSRKTWY